MTCMLLWYPKMGCIVKRNGKRNMASEPPQKHPNIALPPAEASALRELGGLLRAAGALEDGAAMPLFRDETESRQHPIGAYVAQGAVVALALRGCGLATLPDSLGQFSQLERLDVTGNQLTALPEALGTLRHLKALLADENQLTT